MQISSLSFRLMRLVLFVTLCLTALTAGSVYLAQLPDEERCLLMSNITVGIPTEITYDTIANRVYERPINKDIDTILSPDGEYVAAFTLFGDASNHFGLTFHRQGENQRQIIFSDLPNYDYDDIRVQLRWAPDSHAFAFMWTTRPYDTTFLSLVANDGTLLKTITYENYDHQSPYWRSAWLIGWSADSQYIAVIEDKIMFRKYRFLSAHDLEYQATAIDGAELQSGTWSSTGASFAAQGTMNGTPYIVIVSLQEGTIHRYAYNTPDTYPLLLAWSPDDRHLATVGELLVCSEQSQCQRYLRYTLVTNEGEAVVENLVGVQSGTIPTDGRIIPGMWVDNEWVWVEQTTEHSNIRLMAFDVDTHNKERLIDDVFNGALTDMFYVPKSELDLIWSRNYPDRRHIISRFSQLVVPHWEHDQLVIDLVNIADRTTVRLLNNASELLMDWNLFESNFWSNNGETIRFVWRSRTEPSSFVTIVNFDDLSQFTSSMPADFIRAVRWINTTWLGYLRQTGNVYYFSVLNAETGNEFQMEITANERTFWNAEVSAEENALALYLYRTSSDTPATVYLMSLGLTEPLFTSTNAVNPIILSSNGLRGALQEQFDDYRRQIVLIDQNGSITTVVLSERFEFISLSEETKWTNCAP